MSRETLLSMYASFFTLVFDTQEDAKIYMTRDVAIMQCVAVMPLAS